MLYKHSKKNRRVNANLDKPPISRSYFYTLILNNHMNNIPNKRRSTLVFQGAYNYFRTIKKENKCTLQVKTLEKAVF